MWMFVVDKSKSPSRFSSFIILLYVVGHKTTCHGQDFVLGSASAPLFILSVGLSLLVSVCIVFNTLLRRYRADLAAYSVCHCRR